MRVYFCMYVLRASREVNLRTHLAAWDNVTYASLIATKPIEG